MSIQKAKFAIIGSGISGLSLAWYLSRKIDPKQIVLIEKDSKLGGWIDTTKEDGFLFERGPRTFRPSKSKELIELIEDVGILDEILAASNIANTRYIVHKGKLKPVPGNILDFFTSPLTRSVLPALLKEWLVPSEGLEDESIYNFITRRFNRKTALQLFDPLTIGIYAGDIRNLSVRSCFPSLFELEKDSGTITRGLLKKLRDRSNKDRFIKEGFHRSSLFTLRYGLNSLVSAIASRSGVDIQMQTEVLSIEKTFDGMKIETSRGDLLVEHVALATPAPVTANLLNALNPDFSYLSKVECATLVIVHLGYKKKVLNRKGFGYLVPSQENDEILGMIWDSDVFPEQNLHPDQTRLSVMMGGAIRPEITKLSESEAIELAINAAKRHLNIHERPDVQLYTLAKECIPQYEVGHYHKMHQLEKRLNHLYPEIVLSGNFLNGVSVNECIVRSAEVAKALTEGAVVK